MKAALYARMSTSDDFDHIQRQLKPLRGYCFVKDWQVHEEYTDLSIDLELESDSGLTMLLEDAATSSFDVVMALDPTRLSRNPIRVQEILSLLKFYGIEFITLNDQGQ